MCDSCIQRPIVICLLYATSDDQDSVNILLGKNAQRDVGKKGTLITVGSIPNWPIHCGNC